MPDDEDVASFPRTVHDDLRHRRFSWSNPKTATVNTKMNVPYEQLPLGFVYPGGENSTCLLSFIFLLGLSNRGLTFCESKQSYETNLNYGAHPATLFHDSSGQTN